MAVDIASPPARRPGTDLGRFVPAENPAEWPRAYGEELLHWKFLDEVSAKPVRPWLVIEETSSSLGVVRFAVPRLAPEAGWADRDAYCAWEESTWRGETTPIAATLSVDEAAARLPRSRTRPRWASRDRLISLAVRADFEGKSSAAIVEEDGEGELRGERTRSVRRQAQGAREFLAAVGALPWAAFEDGDLHHCSGPWWRAPQFEQGLAAWRSDGTDLSWRHGRENGPEPDPVREAASVILRAPWVSPDPGVAVAARAILAASASDFEGSIERWLDGLIAYPHQSTECRQDLVRRSDENGSAAELRAIWREARPDPPARH
jgi:hypothetical protein